jgi:hypothetical protein
MVILWSKVCSSWDMVSSQRLLVLIIFLSDVFDFLQSAPDVRILRGPLTLQFILNPEETRMNGDEDTFFEDDESDEEEEDDDFPDVEVVEEDDDDYEPIDALYDSGEGRIAKFAEDPWPSTTFVLVIIGLAMVLLTPPGIWALWNYFLIAEYLMLVVCGAAIAYSLITWSRAGTHRLRWAGVTSLVLILALVVLTTLDTFSWVVNLQSIIPGIQTPIITLALVLAIFSIYSLWIIQRNFAQPKR